MRDHKFRIWTQRYGEGEMLYLTPYKQRYDYESGFVYAFSEDYSEFYAHENYESSDEEFKVMQFAFRSHEIDLYEGDIIELDSTEIGGKKYIGEIAFNDDPTLSNLGWGLWVISGGYLTTDFMGRIKLLGNRFQNPELLK